MTFVFLQTPNASESCALARGLTLRSLARSRVAGVLSSLLRHQTWSSPSKQLRVLLSGDDDVIAAAKSAQVPTRLTHLLKTTRVQSSPVLLWKLHVSYPPTALLVTARRHAEAFRCPGQSRQRGGDDGARRAPTLRRRLGDASLLWPARRRGPLPRRRPPRTHPGTAQTSHPTWRRLELTSHRLQRTTLLFGQTRENVSECADGRLLRFLVSCSHVTKSPNFFPKKMV